MCPKRASSPGLNCAARNNETPREGAAPAFRCELRDLSDPRDCPQTVRRVRHSSASPTLRPSIDTLVPRRLSNSLPPFFSPSLFTFLHHPLVPQAAPSSTYSLLGPQNRYEWENVVARRLTLIPSTPRQHYLVDRRTLWAMTPVRRSALQQVAVDLVTRRP
jgi:hypothetical protein